MTPGAALWAKLAGWTALAAASLAVLRPPAPPRAPVALALPAAVVAGVLLFVVLERSVPRWSRAQLPRGVGLARAAVLVVLAANEEAIWRRVVVGEGLAVSAGFALTAGSLGFALAHRARRATHLLTGGAFGAIYLAELRDRQAGGLSGGQRRRLAVALAFAGAPSLVVLDEPTAGLDAEARRAVWDAVQAHRAAGGTVLLTTHSTEEAEALADRVAVIDGGRIVTDGPVAEIKRAAGLTQIAFRRPAIASDLQGAVVEDGRVRILAADAGTVVARLVRDGVPLVDLEVRPASLQEALDAFGEER